MPTLTQIQHALRVHASPERARISRGFFRTGKGEYGEEDQFIGTSVPQTRDVAKRFATAPLSIITTLLHSAVHEERLLAWLILVEQYRKENAAGKETIYDFYLAHTAHANNWDLVDLTADKIVGAHLEKKDRAILYQLAKSKSLWERRIAIVSTFHFIRKHEFADTLNLTERLMHDTHDLIHKACGWMLREVGKKDEKVLRTFLDTHAHRMPRTMLRYSIERLPPRVRAAYMQAKTRASA